jgi:uncharacterized zinc-type alcohol dehydrogenase-like protein
MNTFAARAFGTKAPKNQLESLQIQRREVQAMDVEINILYCGVCHSDIHTARNEWGGSSVYPVVPGHEIVGKVRRVGAGVTKFKVGDLAAVGCMVDSCRTCEHCQDGLENYCTGGTTYTYNSPDKHLGGQTYGGYADSIVVDEAFVLHVPENLDLAAAAPLLCAGITTYSPLKHWKAGPGKKVGVMGLGGLGHMAIKIAVAMGADVTVLTTSESKKEDAFRLGAKHVILSRNEDEMRANRGTLDLIINTVSAQHDLNQYLSLLRLDGSLVLVGLPEDPFVLAPFSVVAGRKSFSGSSIGSIAETAEMLEFCAKHNIVSDIELIKIQDINQAYERLIKGDVKYRFVIDMASLKEG